VAERLGRGLQNLLQQFESARYLSSRQDQEKRHKRQGGIPFFLCLVLFVPCSFFLAPCSTCPSHLVSCAFSMRYSNIIGILACLLIIVSCFMPWTFHPDLQKYFTGFYSEQNMYGRPGKLFLIFAIISILLFVIPKVWAKRTNWLIAALTIAYTVKTYFLFTSCYSGICPIKQFGIYLLLASVVVMFLAALLPDMKMKG
jgi:hypothetical protein